MKNENEIRFRVEDDRYIFINLISKCDVFSLGTCVYNEMLNQSVGRGYNNNIGINSLLTQYVDILGYKI